MNRFRELFGDSYDFIIKAPGRTELGGNHTDHQHGLVLAAPIDLGITACVKGNSSGQIRLYSEGYGLFTVDLSDTRIHQEEYNTVVSLIRGIAASFVPEGLKGFDAYVTSDIPAGSGLSSSAAMEILLGKICCALTGTKRSPVELAILGQQVENDYFGKPCGLMDQMACASSGIIAIDFQNPKIPRVQELSFDFAAAGYCLCIIKCGSGHENLTDQYAQIPLEISKVCELLGVSVLRDAEEQELYRRIPEIRRICGDRAVLRCIHVLEDNKRVNAQVRALLKKDLRTYFHLVQESGQSSWQYLQNVIPENASFHQDMAFALAVANRQLHGTGACRVHGGGFAGTIQAYVPLEQKETFQKGMEDMLGEGCCLFVQAG